MGFPFCSAGTVEVWDLCYSAGSHALHDRRVHHEHRPLRTFLAEEYEQVIRYTIADAFADSFAAETPVTTPLWQFLAQLVRIPPGHR